MAVGGLAGGPEPRPLDRKYGRGRLMKTPALRGRGPRGPQGHGAGGPPLPLPPSTQLVLALTLTPCTYTCNLHLHRVTGLWLWFTSSPGPVVSCGIMVRGIKQPSWAEGRGPAGRNRNPDLVPDPNRLGHLLVGHHCEA
jgi:hypothetical protein